MADNFLERHQFEYEKRKEKWLLKKKHIKSQYVSKRRIYGS